MDTTLKATNPLTGRDAAPPAARAAAGHDDARIRRDLGMDSRSRWTKRLTTLLILGGLGVGGFFLYQHLNQPAPPPTWQTVVVERGDLTTTVTATGSLAPVRTVDVGAEISGRIISVAVKENDRVTAGQVLVEIDPELLRQRLEQAEAQLDVARASVREARATLAEARVEETRVKGLQAKGIATDQALASASATRARAQARLASAQASERQSAAQLESVKTDLGKAVITSPIDGVVLSRQVEPGNTVASSLQAPVLLTLAQDLRQMELHLAIDEADVGVVREGQRATFTVDAYPDRTFEATLTAVWFASQTVSNVVTYRAVLTVDNDELLLRPGMTTTATITTGVAEDVLIVPNAALRYTPPRDALGDLAAAGGRRGPARSPLGGFSGPPGAGARPSPEAMAAMRGPRVWVLDAGGALRPARVTVGKTDGARTEIASERLKEGDTLVTGQQRAAEGS